MCIGANTEILTKEESGGTASIPAKDIKIGDKLLTISSEQLVANENEEYSLLLENVSLEETVVTEATLGKENIVWFNNDKNIYYTLNQPIFTKTSDGVYSVYTSQLKVGDSLLSVDPKGVVSSTLITSIHISDDIEDVYTIRTAPNRWFIAGGNVVIS
jgi:hypothetical protein